MKQVQTALIGLGYWGPNVLRNFVAQSECDMVAMCDLSEERLSKAKAYYPSVRTTTNAEEIFTDPSIELILIATPTSSHFALATKALESGKHVFVEKPLASTPAQADALVALAKKQGKLLFVDHTFVFAPAVVKLQEMVAQGELGNLLYFESSRINLGLIQKDTNALFDLAIHDLSILHTLVDLRTATSVAAHGSKHFGSQEEQVHLHLTFQSGFTAHIHVSWLSPVKIRQTIIAGTKAMALYDDTHPSEKLRIYDRGIDQGDTKADLSAVARAEVDPFFPKYRAGDIRIPALASEETLSIEARHVLRCMQGEEQPRVPGEDGALIVNILHRADASLKQGNIVLPLP